MSKFFRMLAGGLLLFGAGSLAASGGIPQNGEPVSKKVAEYTTRSRKRTHIPRANHNRDNPPFEPSAPRPRVYNEYARAHAGKSRRRAMALQKDSSRILESHTRRKREGLLTLSRLGGHFGRLFLTLCPDRITRRLLFFSRDRFYSPAYNNR